MKDSFSNVTIYKLLCRTKTKETVSSSHLILPFNIRTIHNIILRTYLDRGYRVSHTLPGKARAP